MRISVVIPAYNAEGYVGRAVKSVLAQTRAADEIIVVDDGSSDGTAGVVKGFGDSVRYVYQENKGVAGARNRGIREAGGDWIAFLDADDEWLPENLVLHCGVLQAAPELEWVAGNFICCLCDTERRGPHVAGKRLEELLGDKCYFDDYLVAFRHRASGHLNTMLIKRTVLMAVGLLDETLRYTEDIDLWWKIAYRCPRVGYIAEPTAIYHMRAGETLTHRYLTEKVSMLNRLFVRHVALADECGRLAEFRALADFVISSTVRGLLFYDCAADTRSLLQGSGHLLCWRWRGVFGVALLWPGLTRRCLRLVSRVVRRLGLRKRVVRPAM